MPEQARVDIDQALVPNCVHGQPCCPHTASGPPKKGSDDVLVNGRKAVRLGDPGRHVAKCCGSNDWTAVEGSDSVFINGMPAHRKGDKTKHCGGMGEMKTGSDDVLVGGSAQASAMQDAAATGKALCEKCG